VISEKISVSTFAETPPGIGLPYTTGISGATSIKSEKGEGVTNPLNEYN